MKPCLVCGSPQATETTRRMNGLPKGLWVCQECRQAVKRAEVGVTVKDGAVSVTDGRFKLAAQEVA